MQFMCDAYNDIALNVIPAISLQNAVSAASNGIGLLVTQSAANPDLKILPVPANGKNEYHLVYEVTVKTTDNDNFPVEYYTLVDAHTGKILYRQNRINYIANIDVNLKATVYPTQPYLTSAIEPLPNLFITIGGVPYVTDASGYLGLPNTSGVNAIFKLEGTWARVQTGNTVPQFTTPLTIGTNNITFSSANIRELSAYNSVNEIHDYYVTKLQGTGAESVMDFQMKTIVDVSGNCNAFYNGDLNFYASGGNCNATAVVNDVVYHEYGHGINYDLYNYYGGSFGNGALGEGYADTWANGLTEDPVLGIGFFSNDPNGFVRRYDQNRKIYPDNIQGEVHADGEIIAGAWWDVALNFNSVQARQDLYVETFAATLDAPSGQEGQLYTDILIEALTIDDNDGDLTNGTPNYCAITSAFALHGINAFSLSPLINHSEQLSAAGQQPILLTVTSPVNFTSSAGTSLNGYYRISNSGSAWNVFNFTANGSAFEGTIPAQPNGTIIEYYVDATDQCNSHFNITPKLANDPNPNIPYYILVGFNLLQSDYFDNGNTGWTTPLPGDNATTGLWVIAPPVASIANPGSITPIYVQTPLDHTPTSNNICAVTGNAANTSAGIGDQDIDGGKTSLLSPNYDLSSFTNPAISYWRWYSNDQGATPGTDFWQVYISNDGGATFTTVENTNVSDHGWRRFAFKVSDYVTPTATMRIKFVGEDANAGSLVEAAMDDLEIWDAELTGIKENNIQSWYAFPNPAQNQLSIGWKGNALNVIITLFDNLGQVVYSKNYLNQINVNDKININGFSNGIYTLQLKGEKVLETKKITIVK
jgi:hypothetical protein